MPKAARRAPSLPDALKEVLEPFDQHNQALLANLHPLDYTNPEPQDRYHLVVIGGGVAGLVSAVGAAGLGAKVAMIESTLLGGDCTNYGCVPSKAIIRASRAWHQARTGAERFGAPAVSGDGDFAFAMERMRKLRTQISRAESVERLTGLGIDLFFGHAAFTSPDRIEVAGAELNFRRAIVASGAAPMRLPIPGLEETGYLTNETIFTLTERPRRLGLIGAGPIGCELAQTFARFGTEVHLFDMAPHVLIREDADAAEIVQQALIHDGVRLELEAKIKRIEGGAEQAGGTTTLVLDEDGGERRVEVDTLLVAVGRVPRVEGFGLEQASIAYDKRKGVQVDDNLRTTNSKVFAVGDVASKFQFTHMADALARIAIQNALFFGRKKASDLVVPWCTYTDPEIAHVGRYEKDAKEAGYEVDTITIPMADVDRAELEGSEEGFLRVHLEKGKDRILGATLVADHAGDMLGELCLAVTHQIGLGKIASVIHPYPTQGEVLKKAADAYNRTKLTPTVQKLFATIFKIFK